MNNETIHTEERNGYTINIYPDYDYDDTPNDWGGPVLVHYHRDFLVEHDCITKDDLRAYYQGEKIPQQKEYWIFPVAAYIHGGVSLSLGNGAHYPDQRWDVSHVGAMLVRKSDARLQKTAHKYAENTLGDWNAINGARGGVYGFTVERDGDTVESCWGFIEHGYDIENSDVLDEARAHADYAHAQAVKTHVAKRKAQILNHVPLLARA